MKNITPQNRIIIGTVIGFVLGVSTGFAVWGGRGDMDSRLSDTASENASQQTAAVVGAVRTDDTVVVEDQVAGKVVMIAHAKLTEPGWVAVFEDKDGDLGNVLGARDLPAGEYDNFPVPLLRGTTDGATYYVGIYRENGDGQFGYHTDTLMRSPDGEMVGASFVAR